jgi:hypothetical protein
MCPFQTSQISQSGKSQVFVLSALAASIEWFFFEESPSWHHHVRLSANHDFEWRLVQSTNQRRGNLNILRGPFQLLVKSHAQGVFDRSDRLQMLACCQAEGCSLNTHYLHLFCEKATTPIKITQKVNITSRVSTSLAAKSMKSEPPPAEFFNSVRGLAGWMIIRSTCRIHQHWPIPAL